MSEVTITDNGNHTIYRFKFNEKFAEQLMGFAKLHQFDDRTTYKEAWENWMQENNQSICEEARRLENNGYTGNVIDKMYKSARYYFRKKPTCKKEAKQRRVYVSMDHEVLDAMDEHIKSSSKIKDYCPASGYNDFCVSNKEIIKTEIERLVSEGLSCDEIKLKIKKTYKNRYFLSIGN